MRRLAAVLLLAAPLTARAQFATHYTDYFDGPVYVTRFAGCQFGRDPQGDACFRVVVQQGRQAGSGEYVLRGALTERDTRPSRYAFAGLFGYEVTGGAISTNSGAPVYEPESPVFGDAIGESVTQTIRPGGGFATFTSVFRSFLDLSLPPSGYSPLTNLHFEFVSYDFIDGVPFQDVSTTDLSAGATTLAPEPATVALAGAGVLLLGAWARRRAA